MFFDEDDSGFFLFVFVSCLCYHRENRAQNALKQEGAVMEKIKLEVAGIPAVLYGKRSRKVYLYVHGKNGSAAEAARFARTACPAGWQVLAVDLPEHGTRKNSPEKLVPWVVTRELQAVYARMQPVWKHIRVYGVSIGAWFAMQALQTQQPEKALLVSPMVDMEKLILGPDAAGGGDGGTVARGRGDLYRLRRDPLVAVFVLGKGTPLALESAHTGALCRYRPSYRAYRHGAVPAADRGAPDHSGGRGTLVPYRDAAGRSAKLGKLSFIIGSFSLHPGLHIKYSSTTKRR